LEKLGVGSCARVYCATDRVPAAARLFSLVVAAFNGEPDFAEIAQARRLLATKREVAHPS
jgi:hypothetical protein